MPHLKSIICFNGGAGGDFLKAICLTQFSKSPYFVIEDSGMTEFNHHYFKLTCARYYHTPFDWTTIDQSQIYPVDNAHYYFDWFNKISSAIYYIEYPDNITDFVINTYICKRHQGNKEEFIKTVLCRVPPNLIQKVSVSSALIAIQKDWIKNQQTWRSTANMRPINLLDLFDLEKMKQIVPEITQQDLVDVECFKELHSTWINKNQGLLQSCL